MRLTLALTLLTIISSCAFSPVYAADLQNHKLTPGALVSTPIEVLCATKTNLTRNVSASLKARVYRAYGIKQAHRADCTGPSNSCYEIDHLVTRKIGGADVFENLWPQAYDGSRWNAHAKDKLEARLNKKVCTDKTMTQRQAVSCISTNWIACYKETFNER